MLVFFSLFFFFFNDTATTEIYTLSLHDALPISTPRRWSGIGGGLRAHRHLKLVHQQPRPPRSEEHTSELQSQSNLVCRLLLEKKTDNETNPLPLKQEKITQTKK